VTGGTAPVSVAERPARFGAAQRVAAGAVVRIGRTTDGLRSYLACSGGVAVPPVLGSRSTDTLAGLGPAPLRDGDLLPLGVPTGEPSTMDGAAGIAGRPAHPSTVEIRTVPGPRADWFERGRLAGLAYTVSPRGNRVGVRLTGPALTRVREHELPSEGLVLGAVQVPADGQPVIFLADHPTTGGYPVIAVVHPADLPLLAQARPGTTVVFRGPQR
jgi:biotin-dependent carboxylase-like uncharacterized protein